MDFGFTNDRASFEAAAAWRDAAVADGWSVQPTYGAHEGVERAAKLTRDGFVAQVITRTKVGKWLYEASVSVWGPDGLAVAPPNAYDWSAIVAATKRCSYCKAPDVETERVGFAGRCCAACLPAVRQCVERPGWDR